MPFQAFSFNQRTKAATRPCPPGGLLAWSAWPDQEVLASLLAAWRDDRPIALLNPALCALPAVQQQLQHLGFTPHADARAWSASPDAMILSGLPPGFQALLMTSGTTGEPRLVALDRTSVSWNVAAFAGHLGLLSGERTTVFCQVPLFHAFGLTLCFFHALLASHRLLHSPRFNPVETLQALASARGRVFLPFVPAQAQALLTTMAAAGPTRRPAVHGVTVLGGDRVEASLLNAMRRRLPHLVHTVGYGLTEAGPALTHTAPDAAALSGGIGRPLPGVRLLTANGSAAYFSSPGQCAALWNQALGCWEESRGRWLPTGDVLMGSADGSFYTVGRRRWTFKKSGETIFPATLEAALEEKLRAQLGTSCAVLLASAGADDLALWVEGLASPQRRAAVAKAVAELPRFYRPTQTIFVADWPRNALGKVDRSKIIGVR